MVSSKMRPADDIKRFIDKAAVSTNPQADKAVLDVVLTAYEKATDKVSPTTMASMRGVAMRSPIGKVAAALALLLTVLAGVYYLGGSTDGAAKALGQMREAMTKVPWIHMHAEVDTPEQKGETDEWMCFEKAIEIAREADGTVRYRDETQDVMHVYDPAGKTILITSLSDRYAVPRRVPLPTSPTDALDRLMEAQSKAGNTEISVTSERVNGEATRTIRVITQLADDLPGCEDLTITVNAESKLPISMEAVAVRADGTPLGKSHAVFDYPREGPSDIYSLGVPQDARVIDRRPNATAARSGEIHYAFTIDLQNPARHVLLLNGAVSIDLVMIPPGEFLMGSPDVEIGYPASFLKRFGDQMMKKRGTLRPTNEGPQHLVKIARGFYLSKCEITCAQFRTFRPEFRKLPGNIGPMQGKPKRLPMDLDDQPVCVSLKEATEFCRWLSEKTGLTVRLPSEAEWEYACRAGTQTRFFWGDAEEEAGKYANVADKAYAAAIAPDTLYTLNTDDGTVGLAAVGQFLPNGFGLYDMIGNAPEWVQGIYSEGAYSIDPQNRRFDPNAEDNRKPRCRGGGWQAEVTHCRCASRMEVPEDLLSSSEASTIGIRIVVDQPR
jgi:formylglycine-generating enzyme required for sulfatase activity